MIILPAASAAAGDVTASVNGRSVRVGATEDWNESNLGLGLEYQFAGDSDEKSRS